MTSKHWCFDRTIFRRALKKTAPVWILFTLYELLLPLRLFSYCKSLSVHTEDYLVQIQRTILGYAVINASAVSFIFGGLLAWALFHWLFRSGSAYFYASLPVQRETLFLTNYLTGLMLCAVPAFLCSVLLWVIGTGFGAAALLPAMQVFAATVLGFILFFSFAVLICMIVGQVAAVPIVYVILNFSVYVLEAIVQHLLFTFVYGLPYSQTDTAQSLAHKATPLLGLLDGGFRVVRDWNTQGMDAVETAPRLEGWLYLGVLAGLGLVFAFCALLLLKHREMERSGDVIAVRWLRPVALYVFTIGCALVLGALMAELFADNIANNFWYVLPLLFLGAFLGFFSGKMLLQKTVHVFRSGWIGLGSCCLALLLLFGAAEFDLFGYSRYIPARSGILAAGLTMNQYQGEYTSTDPAYIDSILSLHTALVDEMRTQERRKHDYQTGTDQSEPFYITYRMSDGRLIERYYSVVYDASDLAQAGSLIARFDTLYNSPTCVRIRTGFDTPRTRNQVLSCYVYSRSTMQEFELTGEDAWQVYTACLDDINAGLLGASDVSGIGTDETENYTPLSLIFTVSAGTPGYTNSLSVDSIPLSAASTVQILTLLGADPYWVQPD